MLTLGVNDLFGGMSPLEVTSEVRCPVSGIRIVLCRTCGHPLNMSSGRPSQGVIITAPASSSTASSAKSELAASWSKHDQPSEAQQTRISQASFELQQWPINIGVAARAAWSTHSLARLYKPERPA